jgi:hypothetical protein
MNLVPFGCKQYSHYKSYQLRKAIPFNSFQMTTLNASWYTAVNLKRTGPLTNTILAQHNFNNTYFQQIKIVTVNVIFLSYFYFHGAQKPDTLIHAVCGFQSLQSNAETVRYNRWLLLTTTQRKPSTRGVILLHVTAVRTLTLCRLTICIYVCRTAPLISRHCI